MESSESRSFSAPPPDGRSSFTATATATATPTPTTADALYRVRSLNGRTVGPARRSTKGQWTAEEDEILRRAVQRFKGKNWKKIAECFKDRTDVQCLHRWQKVLNPELVKGPWSKEEDEIIIELVNKYGPKKWSTIAQHLPGRIGKQCRERWHNHLNPAINKEAWTQEEELILIRAHQLYGNKWAELTKFLPGRTDNSIKNHWNSSVKKKLDSYLASGLLEQFQGLPLVVHQTQALPSASSKMQNSADDSGAKCGMEAEEISECSQESIGIGCTEAANDLGNAVLPTGEETPFPEDSSLAKEHCSSSPSCAEPYYASPEDARFSIPEMPCEAGCSSDLFHRNFSHNPVTSASRDYQLNMQCIPHIAALQSEQYSGLPTHCTAANQCHELVTGPFQALTSYNTNTGMGNFIASSAKLNHILISDEECCRFFFSEAMNGAIFSSANLAKDSNVVDLGGSTNSLIYQSSNIQISEIDRTDTSGAHCPSASDAPEPSCSQSFPSGPVLLSAEDCVAMQCREPNQLTGHSTGTHEEEIVARVHDGFIFADDSADFPCDDGTDLPEQPYKESAKLVPVNSFTLGSENMQYCSADEKPNVETEQQEAGTLCYEPPRFPGLDIPFLSCDLVQSGSDMHQDYSPLGIRQLMSSMNCISPFRLWESPSRDNSPDGLLKSAAKTFTGTPSILKKRNRDLLSPLSDRKVDKKLEIDVTSSLAKEFSRLEVMFDDCETQRISLPSPLPNQKKNLGSPSEEDKENFDPALEGGQEKGSDLYTISHSETSEKNINSGNSKDNTKQGIDDAKIKVHPEANAQILEQPLQVIVEDNMNDPFLFSPDQLGFKGDKAFGPSARTPRNLYRRILGTLSEQALAAESSSGSPCLAVGSPTVCRKNHESQLVAATSAPPSGNVVENIGADAGENISIFGETPFKRSIESPSAWKSPWFINSFLPGPRIDSEFSIEDIGYLLSPGDRSLDALALMKQLSEHTASAFADALEVLGNETPETLLSEGRSRDQNMDQGKSDAPNDQPDNHSNLSSSILTERRVLDFSECGTPGKGKEKGKSPASISFSSPSAYLLKGCR